ncbi:acyl-CoA dehydrogenase family protein [Phenylobacterium sp.]|jgi:alkylation response protein AidB-like acyl-CoA dehydrogenase|uniref:acyl-CoA dehydrogenase family protein n=1 Tax=Phenylobacterium sp. TaxID=1871053 RepID=UPI002E338C35|nr:acyl-CoA dehydrogenase family protein [Phenylobacterium sp.]HEX3366547.1 acyl-CoA dehydrogenase family protein [Phenylobacterium sp.]
MDFNDSPDEAAYRAQVKAWLEANAPKTRAGDDDLEGGGSMAASKAWQAKKAAAGYAQITWPKEWGGSGGTPIQQVIFNQEEAGYPIPGNPFQIGLGMCVPTVMTFADDATKTRFVGPALRGEEIWCQLFSEPSGGSDVAAARTKALRAGDGSGDWLISGQKVWTTGAQFSDFGIVVCRTDPDAPKHQGLTMFWVDMRDPGIEVKPIHQMSGGSGFNEVFFTDVRVKDSQRLGAVDDGWKVSLVTLMNERLAVGGPSGAGWAQFLAVARAIPGLDGAPVLKDQAIREKLADWYVATEGLKHTRNRTMTALSRGQTPGPESSIGKVVSALQMQDLGNTAIEMLDQYGILNDPELAPLQAAFHWSLMFAPGLRIAGGTDEILKNIIAERVLGLPGDIRVDKDVAFKDMPTGR